MTCRNGSHYECHKCRERATCEECEDNAKVEVSIKCRECGAQYTLEVNATDYFEWQERPYTREPRHIQDIFPYLTAGERELFITRVCDKCFNRIFNEEY